MIACLTSHRVETLPVKAMECLFGKPKFTSIEVLPSLSSFRIIYSMELNLYKTLIQESLPTQPYLILEFEEQTIWIVRDSWTCWWDSIMLFECLAILWCYCLCSPASLLCSDLISALQGLHTDYRHALPAIFPIGTIWWSTCMNAGHLMSPICLLSAHPLLECPLWLLQSISAFCQDYLPATCSSLPGTDGSLLCLSLHVLGSDLSNHNPFESFTSRRFRSWAKPAEFLQARSLHTGSEFCTQGVESLSSNPGLLLCLWETVSFSWSLPYAPNAMNLFLCLIPYNVFLLSILFWHLKFLPNYCHMPLLKGSPCPLKSGFWHCFLPNLMDYLESRPPPTWLWVIHFLGIPVFMLFLKNSLHLVVVFGLWFLLMGSVPAGCLWAGGLLFLSFSFLICHLG